MNILYLCLGILVFTLIILDIIKTALSSSGGGRVTNAVTNGVWKAFFLMAGKRGTSKLLSYSGPAILVSILLTWVLGLWSGLFLVLLSDPGSVVNSKTLVSAGPLEKLYYAGFTLSTLGMGDYKASSDVWRLVTSAAAFCGFASLTLSITYFVPVLSAVGLQSTLSLYISGMGKTPQQMLANGWNGKDFSSFFGKTSNLCQMLMQHTMNHHSYPVIHYFHNSKPGRAAIPAIVQLYEAHRLLRYRVPQGAVKDDTGIEMLQTALDTYLDVLKGTVKGHLPKQQAPTTDVRQLQEKGVPLRNAEETSQSQSPDKRHRQMMLSSLLEMDGWSWQEVYSS
ncbi:ion channel [Pontibacter korlensis]|uniref:Potassium channel domain-containing protein n=1 Tax=Pontibacter korlensis TaxID=400092 RepID=A0A0E3ZGR7_9BACT|nr:ion channel [Pontibacter korlensis]AKD04333.1 hypothetical protein PKOR_16080 [Pontibacter korlensis]